MICASIVSETTDKAIEDMQKAAGYADLLEIRVDHIASPDLKKILSARKKPVIITIMPQHENGKFKGTEKERIALLKKAVALGADYIDVNMDCPELNALIKYRGAASTRIIVSYHNFNETPAGLEGIYNKIKSAGADIIKIATFANKLSDNLKIIDLVKKSDRDIIAVCMGPRGEISRILAPLYGSYLTFASLEKGKESAPGQIPAETLRNIYRINDLKPGFKIYGIIGSPVSTSKGYIIHNFLFNNYKLNNIYLNFLADDLKDFADNFAEILSGFSVTMPHKQKIMSFLDKTDPIAAKTGAVNTVVNKDGKLTGYNTDLQGAVKAIRSKTDINNKSVTILGAGGAARAIAFGIIEEGGRLTILNRTVEKAEKLALELNCNAGPLSNFEKIKTDILINMTSAGMHPHTEETPVKTDNVRNMVVFDAIYNPEKTMLLQEAEKNNCRIISGIEMFIQQAAEQFKLWTNIAPDTGLLRDILK